MTETAAYAAQAADKPLAPHAIERRAPGPHDVAIDVLYCGVCHSDLHTARNEWNNTIYPSVPGHEIVGPVTAVGKAVKASRPAKVGVGCMVDSCGHCVSCKEGEENYCENGFTGTYNGPARRRREHLRRLSDNIVVDQNFVLRIGHKDHLAAVAPLLCAGITTYSPLRQWNAGPGKKVGVVGLGGLGHMGVKLAHAMGAHVVLFTTSPDKPKTPTARRQRSGGVEGPGPDGHANSFDFILNTVAASHNLDAYLELLKRDGTMSLVGAPPPRIPRPACSA